MSEEVRTFAKKGPTFTINSREVRVKKIIEYFKDKDKIDLTDPDFASAIRLDKMMELYRDEEIDSLNLYYNMKRMFKSAEQFLKEYKILSEYTDQSNIDYLYCYVLEIAEELIRAEQGISKERRKELLELERDNCFDDYPFARYFIKEYIDYKKSPYLLDFLKEKGLYEKDFSRFLMVICRLDDNLYDQYLKKESENRLSRQCDVIRKLDNIRSGVKTGYTKDGCMFDEVEFYRNLPFYDQDSSKMVIEDFGFKNTPSLDQRLKTLFDNLCCEDSNEIIKYYTSKRLIANIKPIKEEEILNTRYIYNDQEVSEQAKKGMIAYMKSRKIPFLQTSFAAVKNKVLYNKIKREKEKAFRKEAKKALKKVADNQ